MYLLSRLRLIKGGVAVSCAIAALALAGGCAREILSVDFANQQSVDVTTDRQTLLIVGAGFDKTSEVVLEMDGIAPMPLQTRFTTTGMLEATLSRVDMGKALQSGVRYSASVCVQGHGTKACSDKPLLVTVVADGDRRVVGTGVADTETGSVPNSGSGASSAFDSISDTPVPVSEGDGRSLATSAVVSNGPYSTLVTPTPETATGEQGSLTPVPSPTFTSVPTATPTLTPTPTPVPTPTRTPVPGKDVIFLIGGVVNGVQIDPADPAISVGPGSPISGSIQVALRTMGGHSEVFPLGATTSWENPETAYWQVTGSVPSASVTQYTVRVSTMAPSQPGEYFIIVAGAAEHSLSHVMSSTPWDAGIPRWNDGDDVAGWDEAAIRSAIDNGYVTAACYPDSYCDFAATAIVMQVGG